MGNKVDKQRNFLDYTHRSNRKYDAHLKVSSKALKKNIH